LASDIAWFYCGREIVARAPSLNDLQALTDKLSRQIIIWDNFYANDYCPRRFYVGPWSGRQSCADLVINPTGMLHTDKLLMQIVASVRNASSDSDSDSESDSNSDSNDYELWRQCIKDAGVPNSFHEIAHHFSAPVFSDHTAAAEKDSHGSHPPVTAQLAAIEQLLWHWKSPLAREWYPYLMGLKQDLSIADGQLSELRIRKTQNLPLANLLT